MSHVIAESASKTESTVGRVRPGSGGGGLRGNVKTDVVFLSHTLGHGSHVLHSLNCGKKLGIIITKPFNHSLVSLLGVMFLPLRAWKTILCKRLESLQELVLHAFRSYSA